MRQFRVPRTNLVSILLALGMVIFGWLLARELVLTTIAEKNNRLLEKFQQGKPWFDWTLNHPDEVVGPYRLDWSKDKQGGIKNRNGQPVLSLPFGGQTLNTHLFKTLQLNYSATGHWQLRIHHSNGDASQETVSQAIPLPDSRNGREVIDLSQLHWGTYSTEESNNIPRQPGQWGGANGTVTNLLLYFWPDPSYEITAFPELIVKRVLFPWPPAANQQATAIKKQIIAEKVTESTWLPENAIARYRASRSTGHRLSLPELRWFSSSHEVLLAVLILLSSFVAGLVCLCHFKAKDRRRTGHFKTVLVIIGLFPLLVMNFSLPYLRQFIGENLSESMQVLSVLLLVPVIGWAIRHDMVRLKEQPLSTLKSAIATVAMSLFVAACLLLFSASDRMSAKDFFVYFLWAVVQQSIIGPLLADTLHDHCHLSKTAVAFLAGAVFSLLHFPNPSLMLATAFAGTIWVALWLRYRLLLPLAFSHAVLALAFFQLSHYGWLVSGRVGMDFLGF